MAQFKDHFSSQAKEYQKYRPGYPSELFVFLAELCAKKEYVWDAGTGNGQAAVALGKHFDKVLATDASESQILNALPKENVSYHTSPAERCPSPANSFDLITVAQAVHWFDIETFYTEVNRAAKRDAVVAFWTYGLPNIRHDVDALLFEFYSQVVGKYWPPERHYIDDEYNTLPFPFRKIKTPTFEVTLMYSLDHFLSFLGTWSAVKNYRQKELHDPVELVREKFVEVWDVGGTELPITWPIHARVGYCN